MTLDARQSGFGLWQGARLKRLPGALATAIPQRMSLDQVALELGEAGETALRPSGLAPSHRRFIAPSSRPRR
jgi:hypothetical protein